MKTYAVVGLIVAQVVVAAVAHQGATGAERRAEAMGKAIPVEYLPSVDSAKMLALGHESALADLFWIRALLYFNNEVFKYRTFQWLAHYVDLVSGLDPRFRDVYLWGGMAMVFSPKKATFEDVMRANQIMEPALQLFPNDHEIPSSMAANCSFYAKDPTEEEQAKLKACTRKYVKIAASRDSAPYYMVLLAAQADSEGGGSVEEMCEFLSAMYLTKQDKDLRAQIEARMQGGQCGEMSIERIQAMRDTFERVYKETAPHMPPDLAVQVFELRDPEGTLHVE